MKVPSFRSLSDQELIVALAQSIRTERHATVATIASIDEFDRRRLFLPAGFSSMFAYCVRHLHMSEGAAYSRIEAVRAARRFPVIYELLADGDISLSTIGLIGRHLTDRNYEALLQECRHKSKREVEVIVARLSPRPDSPTIVRRVLAPRVDAATVAHDVSGAPTAADPVVPPPPRPVIAPLAPERFKLQITMSQETHDTLRQLQNLMRHSVPSGDAAVIVERALKVLLQELLRKKCGMRKRDLPANDPASPEPGGHRPLLH